MSASWGTKVRYTLFGESHGVAIGVVIDGLPPGITFNWAEIEREMMRRAPGGALATARQEADKVEVQSGLYNGKTTGAPLCAIIVNSNQRSSDYDLNIPVFRPSHGDYGGWVRFDGCNDPRGGGPFSGRLTAPLTFAGLLQNSFCKPKAFISALIYSRSVRFKRRDFRLQIVRRRHLINLIGSHFPSST